MNLVTSENLNSCQLRRHLLDQQQQSLMNQESALAMETSTEKINASKQLSILYESLSDPNLDDNTRNSINAQIQKIQNDLQSKEQLINIQMEQLGMLENSVETQSKTLEGQITKFSKEIENIEDAEKDAIDNASPKYKGLG